MRISEMLNSTAPLLSFEFFPPKTAQGVVQLFETVSQLQQFNPAYISVTYGAGGSNSRNTTVITERIQRETGICSMAHLTCIGQSRNEIDEILDDLWRKGIRNILALRGDLPVEPGADPAARGEFQHADQLVTHIRSRFNFSIGVAGYPEGHPQCVNISRDLDNLKRKIDAGADFVVTQLFFNNSDFYRFRDATRARGINVPIVGGIMPIQNLSQIKRFVLMCGAKIPNDLLTNLEKLSNDADAVAQAGTEYATTQCQDLLYNGISGIHFYTLNKSVAVSKICSEIQQKPLGFSSEAA